MTTARARRSSRDPTSRSRSGKRGICRTIAMPGKRKLSSSSPRHAKSHAPSRRPRAPAARTRTRPARAIEQPGRGRTAKRPARRHSAPQRPPAAKRAPATQRIWLLIAAVGALAVALSALTAYILMPGATALTPGPTRHPSPRSRHRRPPYRPARSARRAACRRRWRDRFADSCSSTAATRRCSRRIRATRSASTAALPAISTSAGSAGATALIGPGLAVRLARSHRPRRRSWRARRRKTASANLRFAFQSGLAVSYWKTANLTADFAPIDLTWRVPTLRTDPTGNAIIIEPGIPGDGTGAEIGAIVDRSARLRDRRPRTGFGRPADSVLAQPFGQPARRFLDLVGAAREAEAHEAGRHRRKPCPARHRHWPRRPGARPAPRGFALAVDGEEEIERARRLGHPHPSGRREAGTDDPPALRGRGRPAPR